MTAVTLRDVEREDVEIFFEQQLDPVASEMAAFPSRERDAFFEHWDRDVFSYRRGISQTIVADGVVAGHIVSWVGDNDGRRMLGYWLGREFWGRGIASAALQQFLPLVSERPVFADIATHNIGSRRVLEKNSFVPAWDVPRTAADGIEEMLYRLD